MCSVALDDFLRRSPVVLVEYGGYEEADRRRAVRVATGCVGMYGARFSDDLVTFLMSGGGHHERLSQVFARVCHTAPAPPDAILSCLVS